MVYQLPTFNLAVGIRRAVTGRAAPADVITVGNLALGRRVATIPGSFDTEAPDIGCMWLLLPAGTDVRDRLITGGPDTVEVAIGTGRFYNVVWVDDVASGFPNEHRFACLQRQPTVNPPLPPPTVPPPPPSISLIIDSPWHWVEYAENFPITMQVADLVAVAWDIMPIGTAPNFSIQTSLGIFFPNFVRVGGNDGINEIKFYFWGMNHAVFNDTLILQSLVPGYAQLMVLNMAWTTIDTITDVASSALTNIVTDVTNSLAVPLPFISATFSLHAFTTNYQFGPPVFEGGWEWLLNGTLWTGGLAFGYQAPPGVNTIVWVIEPETGTTSDVSVCSVSIQ